MNIIITMAGFGTRFKKAGYDCPKYMIEAKGKTLFEWSLDSLLDYNPHVEKYIFVVRKEDHSEDFIKEKCKKYMINNISIIELDHPTDGQATTCYLALSECDENSSFLVYNIDTYVEPYEMKYTDLCGDGHIPCFEAPGNHWSFVKVSGGKVTEVCEKKRISSNCSLGAYYFSSTGLYKKIYDSFYKNGSNLVNNEKYIAPLYNYMIKLNYDVTISVVNSKKVHVLGTPNELNEFLSK